MEFEVLTNDRQKAYFNFSVVYTMMTKPTKTLAERHVEWIDKKWGHTQSKIHRSCEHHWVYIVRSCESKI